MNEGIAELRVTNVGGKTRVQMRLIQGEESVDIAVILPTKNWALLELQASALERAAGLASEMAASIRR
ncbi:MAG: hypothetical protein K8F93_14645 [Burkholderiales bacterium]|nr:hypothetical protein [Burkholderiales bacterium]